MSIVDDLCHDSFGGLHRRFKAYVKFEFELIVIQIKRKNPQNIKKTQTHKKPEKKEASDVLGDSEYKVVNPETIDY